MADLRELKDRARELAARGHLIQAIALCKAIVALEPGHGATQGALADLYARRGGAGAPRPAPPPARPLADATTPLEQILSAARAAEGAGVFDDVVVEVDDGAPATPPSAPRPPGLVEAPADPPAEAALPRVPIFSDLSREAFRALADGLILHRFERGAPVLREGDDGTSFFVVASGRLAVSKRDERGEPVALARLGEGDFFGEMALLSGAPRSATVTAEERAEVLELPAELLRGLAGRHPHLAASLRRFYRQRLLANALAVSPVFRPFGRDDRRLIMERFRAREVRPGEAVVREGTASDGLYVILEGAVDVVKRVHGRDRVMAQLREGDLFGEISCLRKALATATVTVRRGGTLLRLPRQAFDELVVTYPQILEAVSELSDERAENLDAILTGHAQWTDEGLVLT